MLSWKLAQPKLASHLSILLLGLIVGLSLSLSFAVPPAEAALLYTADTSGAVIVQSRRSLRDQNRYSWQVIAFKPIQADQQEGLLALRLVGFPGAVELSREPAHLTSPEQPELAASLADLSSQIPVASPQPHVGQYNLATALAVPIDLPTDSQLQLQLATRDRPVRLVVSPALFKEWQTVANTHYSDLVQACDRFPAEARQNPAFPAWVNCSERANYSEPVQVAAPRKPEPAPDHSEPAIAPADSTTSLPSSASSAVGRSALTSELGSALL